MPTILNITEGKRFGRLVVLRRIEVHGARNVMWQCRCDCGKFTTGAAANLGKTKMSCGCLAKETARALLSGRPSYTRTHNMSHHSEYYTWTQMKGRCTNPDNHSYPRYGGRGIKICERWLNSFEDFFTDMGLKPSPQHSIERKDNSGNYTPENCCWASKREQARNTRRNRMITIDGLSLCISEWCERLQIPLWKPREMIRNRGGKRNLPPECAKIEDAIRVLYERNRNHL